MDIISTNLFSQVNYWAVVVAALVTFFLGGLWYSPALFEELWMNANGYSEEQVKQMQSALGVTGFAGAFLAYLLMAMVFALLLAVLNIESVGGGLLLGILIWFGFVATTGLTVNLFSIRPLSSWSIDAAYQLVFLLVTGAILGLWR
ncbi:MAG: DUF1761 domain-containing protein [Gammaproteobacteria bacterium]|nr:DUF1761 domain-containing protein [Gammaproteobacteria bacterium]